MGGLKVGGPPWDRNPTMTMKVAAQGFGDLLDRLDGQYMQDLIAGHIDMVLDNPAGCLPHIRSGAIKAYAVTAKNRLPAAPSIPTVDEAGVPGLYFFNWKALWVRATTPSEIVAKLNSAAASALGDPMLRVRLTSLGRRFIRETNRHPKPSPPFRRPRSRNAANIRGE